MAKERRRTFGTVVKPPSGRYRPRYFYQCGFHNALLAGNRHLAFFWPVPGMREASRFPASEDVAGSD